MKGTSTVEHVGVFFVAGTVQLHNLVPRCLVCCDVHMLCSHDQEHERTQYRKTLNQKVRGKGNVMYVVNARIFHKFNAASSSIIIYFKFYVSASFFLGLVPVG